MEDKEGTGGELLVLPSEPELVASAPRQGVEEGGLLHVLCQEREEGGQGGPIPVVDQTSFWYMDSIKFSNQKFSHRIEGITENQIDC